MTQDAPTTAPERSCIFCAIARGQHAASMVYEDATVVVFMDLNPVTHGHLLVVPRAHAMGFEDLDRSTGGHVWAVGHDMARALRRSRLGCEGINVLVCDGAVAFQTVFHFHLHVIPRYADDGWRLNAVSRPRERALLDIDADVISEALASTQRDGAS
jgi:diadenosine tetraphosphate (Ap4A) HIT family hydrolase